MVITDLQLCALELRKPLCYLGPELTVVVTHNIIATNLEERTHGR